MEILHRPRRLRQNETIRNMVKETSFSLENLIYPLFVVEGTGIKKEIPSMPGVYHFSLDLLVEEVAELDKLGIKSIMLFGVPGHKDEVGSGAYDNNGIIQRALRALKEKFQDILVIADVCLCEYTSHGHCGLVENGRILNDSSVELIVKAAVSYAKAGADMVAPSDMMDGRIGAIRRGLDNEGMVNVPIMAYSAKYSSAYYGPFREAANSAPQFGDRKTYQMDFHNGKEAVIEAELDIAEGADIIMVKPGLAYLDIVKEFSQRFDVPIAVYNVSGEYSMVKAAAINGWIDEKKVVLETITAMKRAGAQIIITYYAKDIAAWL